MNADGVTDEKSDLVSDETSDPVRHVCSTVNCDQPHNHHCGVTDEKSDLVRHVCSTVQPSLWRD